MSKNIKYNLYATDQNGGGYVSLVGTFDSVEEIYIRVSTYHPDVVLTIEEEILPDTQ